jgi:hypothetical protein
VVQFFENIDRIKPLIGQQSQESLVRSGARACHSLWSNRESTALHRKR